MGFFKNLLKFLFKHLERFKTIIVEVFWPWFLENIWPTIQEYIIELLVYMSKEIFRRIKEWFEKRNRETEETISSNIAEAEKKAEESTDQAEIEKQKAIAKVWREAMEMFRRENKDLKDELEKIKTTTLEDAKDSVSNIDLDLKSDLDDTLLLSVDEIEKPLSLPNPPKEKE